MGTARFVLRTDKIDKHGKAPVDLIYQVHGQRKFFRTNEKLYPANWNSDDYLALYRDKSSYKEYCKKVTKECADKGAIAPKIVDYVLLLGKKDVDLVNDELLGIRKQLATIERRFVDDDIPYSSEMVIRKLNDLKKPETKKQERSNYVTDYIERYIADHKTVREANSLKIYKSLRNHLESYLKTFSGNVSFADLNYNFFQQFQNYLIDVKKMNNTTVAKQLSTLKTFLGYARKAGIVISEQYKDFKIKREKLEVIALTNDEFTLLLNYDLSGNDRLAQVRDTFCFACVTGLRYSDLALLNRGHIKNDEISLTIKKTKELLNIPLTPYSSAILDKYKDMLQPLPVISNSKMNKYLKELCKLAAINEPIEIVRFRGSKREVKVYPKYELIGVHTARKTFVTLSLEKGMSAEEVMTISGHSDYKSFQRYVKITEQRKKVVMRKAWSLPVELMKAV